jgi:hypothetical protein
MKIAILNYCGTVGKTTLATNLFYPRLPEGGRFFSIESINTSADSVGVESTKMRGSKFDKLFDEIILEDDAVIDIGASNIEDFLNNMMSYQDGHELIDRYVIPVTHGEKEKSESIATIKALLDMGIEPQDIRIVLNRATVDYKEEFSVIFNAAKMFKIPLDDRFVIRENDIFRLLQKSSRTIKEALNDNEDHKSIAKQYKLDSKKAEESGDLKKSKDLAKKSMQHIQLLKQQAMAKSLISSFDLAYEALNE